MQRKSQSKLEDKTAPSTSTYKKRIPELRTKYSTVLKNVEVSKQASEHVFDQLLSTALRRDHVYQSALVEDQEANRQQTEADLEYDRLSRERKVEVIRQESLNPEKVSFFDKALRRGINDYLIDERGRQRET